MLLARLRLLLAHADMVRYPRADVVAMYITSPVYWMTVHQEHCVMHWNPQPGRELLFLILAELFTWAQG